MLIKAIDCYLAVRRAAGYELEVPEYLLRSFARFACARGEQHVCSPTAIEWASQAPSLNQRDHRLNTVRRFARHVQVDVPQDPAIHRPGSRTCWTPPTNP